MSLLLKVRIEKIDQVKTMRFASAMSVSEAVEQLREKTGEGGQDHGLFQPGEGRRPSRWLRREKTLQFYDLKANDFLIYRKRHRPLRVVLVDTTTKMVLIDDSAPIGDIVTTIGRKMNLKNPEEFSLMSTTKKRWLNPQKTLAEQGVGDQEPVLLKKKWFVTDSEITENDAVQLHLVYAQGVSAITGGEHPLKEQEAIEFAALQCQASYGNFNAGIHKPGFLKSKMSEFVTQQYLKTKNLEQSIFKEYRQMTGMSEQKAKYRYVQLLRSLRSYGMTCFDCVVKPKVVKQKPQPLRIGITSSHILKINPSNGQIIKEIKLAHMRRWAAAPKSFTLDFGDYDDDILTLLTDEGEAMSQQIAGYIDILLKKRNDEGQIISEDDMDVAEVGSVGQVRGHAKKGFTTSTTTGGGGRAGQISMSGGPQRGVMMGSQGFTPRSFKIESLDSAGNAVKTMVEDSSQAGCPQNSSMSVVQWQGQLAQHCEGVAAQSGKLVSAVEAAPPDNIDVAMLTATARQLAMNTGNMLAAAHSTAGAMGGDDHLLATARAVADAVAKLLNAADDVTRNPHDQEKRRLLHAAMKQIEDNKAALLAATKGFSTTKPDQELLLAAAKAVAEATARLLRSTQDTSRTMQSASHKQDAVVEAKKAIEAAQTLLNACKTLGPVALDPDCKAQLLRATRSLNQHVSNLSAAASNSGADQASLNDLLGAAKDVSGAIEQLLKAAEAAEAKPTQNVQLFADKAQTLLSANTRLAASVGQPPEILKNTKATAGASGELVMSAKMMAKNAPDETSRKQLIEAARRVADATKRLVDDAKKNSQRPHDDAARSRLGESSRGLAHATNQLVGDAARVAAEQALRAKAKKAVAATTNLVSLAKSGKANTNDYDLDGNLLSAAADASDACSSLLDASVAASKNHDDKAAQAALAQTARQCSPQAFGLVTTCKASGPRVADPKGKQMLLVAAKAAAESIKELLAATKAVAAASGAAEIESGLELLAVEDAAIDSSMLKADSGMLAPDQNQRKPASLAAVNSAANRLGGGAKILAQNANSPEKLGVAARTVATESVAVTAAARSVASHCEQRTASEVLGKAKALNQASTKLMEAGQAAAQSPGGPASGMLLAAAKTVAQALAALADACNESEPGSKECEQAAQAVLKATQGLGVGRAQAIEFKQASVDLASVAKALSGASSQAATAAQRNKRQLAPAANAVARTYPQVVSAANVAAASAPDQDSAQQIIHRAQVLGEALAAQLRQAKLASPDDPSSQSGLKDATQGVTEATGDLLKLCDTTNPGQRELTSALETVRSALDRLNGGTPAKQARSITDLQSAANQLNKATDGVAATCSRNGTHTQLIPPARAMAQAIDVIADATQTAAQASGGGAPGGGSVGGSTGGANKLAAPAERTHDAIRQLIDACNAGNQRPQLVASAKAIAMACGELVGGARAISNEMKQSDPDASRQLLGAAQPVANATAKLVSSTKAHAQAPSPAAAQDNIAAANALANAVDALLGAVPFDDAGAAAAAPAATVDPTTQALLASARAVAFQVTQLLQASQGVVDKSGCDQGEISTVTQDIHSNVDDLLLAARDAQPGFKELAAAISSVEASISELENAAIDADVGILEPAEGRTLPQCHQSLAPKIKQMATDVQSMLKSIKNPPAMGKAAESMANALASAVDDCKDAASLSSEASSQLSPTTDAAQKLLTTLKALQAAQPPSTIAPLAKAALEAVVAIISLMRGGGSGGAAIDEALAACRAANQQIEGARNGGTPSQEWESSRAALGTGVQSLDAALASAFGTGQRNAKNLPPTTKGLGSAITAIGQASADVACHITDDASRDDFVHSAGTVASSLAAFLEQAKALYNEPNNETFRDQFGTANSNVAGSLRMLTQALDDADGGARACNAAIERLGEIGTELAQAALLAAAGGFDDAPPETDFEQLQATLAQSATQAAKCAAALPNAARQGPAGMAKVATDCARLAGDGVRTQARATAAQMGDARAQARLLNAAQDVANAAQGAVRAAKVAYTGPADDQAARQAAVGAAEAVQAKVDALIKVSKEAEAEASEVAIELDKARGFILGLVQRFPTPQFRVNPRATPVTIVTAAVGLAEASAALLASCGVAQEDVIAATKNSARACENILRDSKHASKTAPDANAQQQLCNAACAAGTALGEFYAAAKMHSKRQTIAGKRKLTDTSDALIDRIGELVDAVALLPNSAEAVRMYRSGEDLETLAARALSDCKARIHAAQQKIIAACDMGYQPGNPDDALQKPKIEEAMADASHGLAAAVDGVLDCATEAQDQMRQLAGGSAFKRDPTWAKGLITSANDVAASVDEMADVAVKAIAQSICEKEEVEKVAKGVASTSARLVASSRAKADPESATQQQLASSQKRVAQVSAILVAVGREMEEYLAAPAIDPLKVEEEAIQQQIKILQLQKKIAKQRAAMARLKGQPVPAAQPRGAPAGRGALRGRGRGRGRGAFRGRGRGGL